MATPVRAGQAYVALGIKDNLDKGLRAAKKKLERFGRSIMGVGKKITAISSAMTAGFIAAAGKFGAFGDALAKSAGKLGMTVEMLQKLQYAGMRGGMEIDQVTTSLQRMIRRLGEAAKGRGAAKKAFEELGLDPAALTELPVADQLGAIADGFQKIGNDSDKVRLAFQIFDTEGVAMLNVLKDGKAGLRAMGTEAEELGLILSGKAAKQAAAFVDAWTNLKLQLRAVVVQIGGAVAPLLQGLMERIGPLLKTVIDWIQENKRLVATIAVLTTALVALGGAVVVMGAIVFFAGAAASAVVTFAKAIFTLTGARAIFMQLGGLISGTFRLLVRFGGITMKVAKAILSAFGSISAHAARYLAGGIRSAVTTAMQMLKYLAGMVTNFARMIGRAFMRIPGMDELGRVIANMINPIKIIFGTIIRLAARLGPQLVRLFTKMRGGIITATQAIARAATLIIRFFKNIGSTVVFQFSIAAVAIRAWLGMALGKMGAALRAIMALAASTFGYLARAPMKALKTIGLLIAGLGKLAGALLKGVFNAVVRFAAVFPKMFMAIVAFISGLPGLIVSGFKAAGRGIKSAAKAIGSVFMTMLEGIQVTFIQFWNFIRDSAIAVSNTIGTIWEGLAGELGNMLSGVGKTFKSIWQGVVAAVTAGDMRLAWEIVLTGMQTALLQFTDGVVDAWLQMNINIVSFAEKAATSVIGIWRKASQKIASWLADRFYEWSVGDENVLTPEERERIKKGSLDATYDKWEGDLTGAVEDFTKESKDFWKDRKEGRQPEAQARVDALQAQLDALRKDAEKASEDAREARAEVSARGHLPGFDFEKIGEGIGKARRDVEAETLERGSVEAAKKANELAKQQTSYQQRLIERMDAQIKVLRELRDKPGVGVA